jgi:cyclopropane-fatty-acyl-phospholipid synthase
MSQSIIPHAVDLHVDRRVSWLDRTARRLVLGRLAGLNHGRVCVEDALGTEELGASAGDTATIRVMDPRFYRRVVREGALGAAASYIDGHWKADDLTKLLRIFVRNLPVTDGMEKGAARLAKPLRRAARWMQRNTMAGSRRNIEAHYDLSNDFFALFLDPTMTYSCGIFESPESSMYDASVAKLDRICRKLDLQPHHRIVEIGTGWGSFALHAARHYGCHVTTTTISTEQHDLARQRIEEAGLEDRITLLKQDYRTLEGQFDRLVSIEMIEAVGHQFLPAFFEQCNRLLKPDGSMLLQAITMPDQRYARYRQSVDFIQKYVFPGSCCPSLTAMLDAVRRSTDFSVGHLEDLTPHYATTLRTWRERFMARLDDVRAMGFPESFIRLWDYYLCYCEAGFAERYIGNVHLILHRPMHRGEPLLPAITPKSAEA